MKRVHQEEMIKHAYSPVGTKVWVKRYSDKGWIRQDYPTWNPDNTYFVDDKDAIGRMRIHEKQN